MLGNARKMTESTKTGIKEARKTRKDEGREGEREQENGTVHKEAAGS